MDIKGILGGLSSVLPTGSSEKQPKTQEPSPGDVTPAPVSFSPLSQHAVVEILSRYDVTQITARDFSQLIQELKQSGAITSADQDELALLRLELDQQGIDPDEPLDLVDLLQRKLQTQERELSKLEDKQGNTIDRSEALAATLRQMDWISKFAFVHQSGGYRPINAVA